MWLKKTFYKKWKWWFLCQRPRTSRGTVPSCWALVPVDLLMNQVIRLGVQLLKWWRKVILRSNKVKLEWIHSTDDSSDISYVKFWALKVIALIKDTKKLFWFKMTIFGRKYLTERDTFETHLWPYWTCLNFVLTRSHCSSQPHFFRYDPSNSTYDSRRQIRWSYIEHGLNLRWVTTSLCWGGRQPHLPMRKIAKLYFSLRTRKKYVIFGRF